MGRSPLSRYKEWWAFLDHALIAGHHISGSIPALSGRMDLYTLQKLSTHKSPTMTQRYTHLRDQALRQAADLSGNMIEQFASGQTDPR